MKTICLYGGGSLGHVIGGFLAAKSKARVHLLTRHPERWSDCIAIDTPDGGLLQGHLDAVGAEPEKLIPDADVVLLCVPGVMMRAALQGIRPYLRPDCMVGCVFSSTGFFQEAQQQLSDRQPLWGFQRVPFIARVNEYGHSAHLLGYKSEYRIAVEQCGEADKRALADWVAYAFERPVHLLRNYYEAALTNSNPLLHTSRLYSLFGGENEGKSYPRMIYFYREWTREAAELLIHMDQELFALLDTLPVTPGFLSPILEYYESSDAASLACKISSIPSLSRITSPMLQKADGWYPDFSSRYFTEDFGCGLHYIWQLAHQQGVATPTIDRVYRWGSSCLPARP